MTDPGIVERVDSAVYTVPTDAPATTIAVDPAFTGCPASATTAIRLSPANARWPGR